jgi:hypothetical protein
MRGLSLLFAVLSFSFLVFGTALSFWITDPLLGKAVTFMCGVFTAISLFLIASSLPTEAETVKKDSELQEDINSIWNRIHEIENQNFNELERASSYLHTRIDHLSDEVHLKCTKK